MPSKSRKQAEGITEALQTVTEEQRRLTTAEAREFAGPVVLTRDCAYMNHTSCKGDFNDLPCICFCHAEAVVANQEADEAAGGSQRKGDK